MIQFNLLPDVKLEYLKTRRTKRLTMLVAGISAGVALSIFILLFVVTNVLQTKHLSDVNKDINHNITTLKEEPDLDKILTVQNQLNSLTPLHDQKPLTTRLFGYLGQLTPSQATISSVKLDFSTASLTISGSADNLTTVNKYVDTLKFTDYKVNGADQKKAFSEVVLTSFSTADKKVSYSITFKFDPTIFDGTKQVELVIPHIISTRSETEKPTDLFEKTNQQQGQ